MHCWNHLGFSVHNRVFVHPRDGHEFEALIRYMMRPPVSLCPPALHPRLARGRLRAQGGHDDIESTEGERIDAMEFVARVLVQTPDPRRHLVRYYGAYSNAARRHPRVQRYRRGHTAQPSGADGRT